MVDKGNPPERSDPPTAAAEDTMLAAWLDFHRETLLWKCEGLRDEQLRLASVPPSSLTLLGLLRHMAEVERGWFAEILGADTTPLYCTDARPEGDLDDLNDADVSADFTTYRAEISTYRELARGRSLDEAITGRRGQDISLRWIYLHMIEEYARHNGHADLLRECIDGSVGD